MGETTIISSWIHCPTPADGWPVMENTGQVSRPSVWLINPARVHSLLKHQYNHLLSEEEARRGERFHQTAHQSRFKATRAALRKLLANAMQAHPETIDFTTGHHNKPLVSSPGEPKIAFNLSYSNNQSIIGIADDGPIGIDIEWLHRPILVDDMLTTCFSPNEIEYITSAQNDLLDRFFTLWTRKEAILKLTGEGIGEHLPLFEVLDGTYVTKKEIIGGNPPAEIYLYSFRNGNDYVGCYATPEPIDRLPIFQL